MKNRSLSARFSLLAMAFAGVLALQPTSARAQTIEGRASVIDGDTLDIHGQRIRLHGIDAPESSQLCKNAQNQAYRCGQQAALALSDQIGARPVACVVKDKDRYGRFVSECFLNGASLNQWMVRNGMAVAYAQYSKQYLLDEAAARREKRGIWTGEFEMPWDFRKKK